MTYIKYFIAALFSSIIFVGCVEERGMQEETEILNKIKNWTPADTLDPVQLPSLSKNLINPNFVNARGNHLTFVESTDENMLNFFSLNDYSLEGRFGKQGEGPGEFSGTPFIVNELPKQSSKISLLDFGKKTFSRVNIQELIETAEWTPETSIMLPPELIFAQRVMYLPKDSSIIGVGGYREGKLFKYSIPQDSLIKKTPFIPRLKTDKQDFNRGYLYFSYLTVNRNENKIAVVSKYFQQLEIYDFNLNLLNVTRLSKEPNFIGDWSQGSMPVTYNTKSYYGGLDSDSDKIFAFYDNRSLSEQKEGSCSEAASEVHVFSWDGKPMSRYKLEKCPLRFAYDHINERIIGIFRTKNPAEIVQYYQL